MDLSDLPESKRKRILEEVKQYTGPPTIQADEFTVRHYAESFDPPMNLRTARDRLRRMVKAGVLEKRYVILENHRCSAFRLVEGAALRRDDVDDDGADAD